MKLIVAGSRSITNYAIVATILDDLDLWDVDITEIVTGDARGVDQLGAQWAVEATLPIKHFPADWQRHGKRAGIVRNSEMASYADALLAIWDGKSKGTANMVALMKAQGKPVEVVRPKDSIASVPGERG